MPSHNAEDKKIFLNLPIKQASLLAKCYMRV